MQPTRSSRMLIVCSTVVFVAIGQTALAGTLCVNPAGSHNCFKNIQTVVNHARLTISSRRKPAPTTKK